MKKRKKYVKKLKNVIILSPKHTFIEKGAQIGTGTIIYPNNYIENGAKIGKNCILYPNNYIKNTTIEGLYTLKSISELVKNKDVDIPIINLMEQIIYQNKNPEELINFLIQKP